MDPARLPEEIAKRQELKAKLETARQQLEERHRQEFAAEVAQFEKRRRGGRTMTGVVMNPNPRAPVGQCRTNRWDY
jgi:hypothetical protein